MFKKIKSDLIYYYILFLVVVLPIIPKTFSTIAGIIPVRLMLISVLLLIYLYDKFILKKDMKRSPKIFIIVYLLFLFFMVFGFSKSISKMLFFYTYAKFIVLGILVFVLSKYKFEKKKVNNMCEGLFYSSLIVSIIGIVQYILDINLNYNGIYKYIGSKGRVISTFFNPIYLGIFLLFIIILLLYKISTTDEKKATIKYFTIMFVDMITLLLTYTRTVAVLLAVTVVLYILFSLLNIRKSNNNICKYLIVFICLIVNIYAIPGVKYLYSSTVVNFLPYKVSYKLLNFTNNYMLTNFDLSIYGFDKLENTGNKQEESNNNTNENEKNEDSNSNVEENNKDSNSNVEENNKDSNSNVEENITDASINTRNAFKTSANRVISDNKLTGVGLGNYEEYVMHNKDKYIIGKFGYPHNSFLHITAECGVITGTILYIMIFAVIVYSLVKVILNRGKEMFAVFIIWINVFILAMYESLFYDTQLCPLLLIITLVLFILHNENKKKITMFISSAGGHLTQLLELKKVFKKDQYVLITEKTGVSLDLKNKYNIEFLKYGSRQYLLSYLFIFPFNIFKSLYFYLLYEPDVVVTTGTHTAVPMCYIGWLFGKKIIYIESFAKRTSPTLSGRLVYPIATTFVVQWESMLKYYPKAECWGAIY